MKLRRDKWEDSRGPVDDPLEEYERLCARLDDWRAKHRIASEHAESCERIEAENANVTADEFRGVEAFDTADRKRADNTRRAVEARRISDKCFEMVNTGILLCDKQLWLIADKNVEASDTERERLQAEQRELLARAAALEGALRFIEAKRHDWVMGGPEYLKLKSRYSTDAKRALENQQLQRDIERNPPRVDEAALVIDAALGVRTVDEGQEVAAYVRLPMDDGGPLPIG
ncbi:MAG TPA: hypothetical protein VIM33_05460 [Gaiellaceae bacterium]|jgi:hypothetical protein